MNNKKTSQTIASFFGFGCLIFLIIFGFSFLDDFLPVEYKFIVNPTRIISGSLLLVFALTYHFGNFFYIEIDVTGSEIRIKNYNVCPTRRRFQVYKISLARFHKIEVKKQLGGLFATLTFYEKNSHGIARYPSIGFSALTKTQKDEFVDFIKKATSKKKK